MDVPPADPVKLLCVWMEWERGVTTPGKTLADLKRAGMRQLLDDLVAAHGELADLERTDS